MFSKYSFILCLIFFFVTAFSGDSRALAGNNEQKKNISGFSGIDFPNPMRFGSVSSSSSNDCGFATPENEPTKKPTGENKTVKFHLKRRETTTKHKTEKTTTNSVLELQIRDLTRIQTLHKRVLEKRNQNTVSQKQKKKNKEVVTTPAASSVEEQTGQLVATLESGMTLGSGEYFMDVLVGSPPKHFSLILDTGSDLNWIQCLPCYDCFQQNGAFYDPTASASYKNITCNDPRCNLVSPPDPPKPCKSDNQSCPYYYWYGDSSNTTGDFAVETFTVNLTTSGGSSELYNVENMMFGCAHWNRGLFHGAAGLLGLGRGPLSFSSQLQSLYGHSFSYCLVDRNSDTNVSSKLIFGEDKDLLSHPNLNFTSFVAGKENLVDTFYYVQIKSIIVAGEVLNIPEETWNISSDGAGGTIIDSGTTLSYFAEPAYEFIKNKIAEKAKGKYPVYRDFPILDPCFNVSGIDNIQLPELGIAFADGAVWNFPTENSFIWLSEDLVCLAILGTPKSAFSIIGNYQQQNFHILYDTKRSRLGYAPTKCADI
ncbi:Xylanase inhibitor C-terminal [Arabidopsis thaliana x Arabidopsis arenosa]|uniref:Xylanase inhibitor C-terminal n=1 Tax=Arabidopsis thaliana x Arabidopsis arenosa TaxID=1240361 RepID=A0A8T1ZS53_9BRAS|nr:Xylanase inhibitor C-terminal [Arabidopsis thaliana x Arabidopsis arenosa]